MDSGLYIAASGMIAEQTRQDQIANDLANASTPGFKADSSSQTAFGQLLLQNSQTGQQVGTISEGARIAQTTTDLSPAPLTQTNEPLDVGLDGPGFLAVQTTAGTRSIPVAASHLTRVNPKTLRRTPTWRSRGGCRSTRITRR